MPTEQRDEASAFDDRLRRRSIVMYAVAVACTALLNNVPTSPLRTERLGLNLVLFPALLALLAIWRFPWRRYHRDAFVGITFISLALVAMAVRFSGGWESVFQAFYFLIVVFNVSYYRSRLALVLATLVAACSLSPALYDSHSAKFVEYLIIFVPTILLTGVVADALNGEVQARARQTASLMTHRQDAERETARLKVLQRAGVVVSTQLDGPAAMRVAVRELTDNLGYAYASAYLCEGEWLVLQAYAGAVTPTGREHVRGGVIERVARTGQAVLIADLAAEPEYAPVLRDACSAVCVSIEQNGNPVGVLNVEHSGTLEPRDIELLELFSQQIAAALVNAQLHAVVAYAARTDSLTGLLNHGTLLEELRVAVARARDAAMPLAVLFFDLDNFKQLNDTYGHQFGDDVLRTVATLLREQLQGDDFIGRYGGEEFMVVLPGADCAAAGACAEAVRASVAAYPFVGSDGAAMRVTVSGGYACFPIEGDEMDTLIYTADLALYDAKVTGKNRVCGAIPTFA